jgi:hypothetical protein
MERAASIWTRLSSWLRLGQGGDDTLLLGSHEDGDSDGKHGGSDRREGERVGGSLSRWNRRDHTLQQIQEGHERVVELVSTIQRHMEVQEQRGEEIAHCLHRMASALEDAPAITRQQVEILSTIASQIAETNSQYGAMAEIMKDLPDTMGRQGKALASIDQQLASAGETEAQMARSLKAVGTSIDMLGTSSGAQLETLQQMHAGAVRQNEQLADLIVHQHRRFTWLFVVTLLLMIVVIGVVGASLWYQYNRL